MTIDTTKEPENFYEAFKNALVLHIIAPTKEESNEALYLAESFSENLTEEEISKGKAEVDLYLDELDKSDPEIKKAITTAVTRTNHRARCKRKRSPKMGFAVRASTPCTATGSFLAPNAQARRRTQW